MNSVYTFEIKKFSSFKIADSLVDEKDGSMASNQWLHYPHRTEISINFLKYKKDKNNIYVTVMWRGNSLEQVHVTEDSPLHASWIAKFPYIGLKLVDPHGKLIKRFQVAFHSTKEYEECCKCISDFKFPLNKLQISNELSCEQPYSLQVLSQNSRQPGYRGPQTSFSQPQTIVGNLNSLNLFPRLQIGADSRSHQDSYATSFPPVVASKHPVFNSHANPTNLGPSFPFLHHSLPHHVYIRGDQPEIHNFQPQDMQQHKVVPDKDNIFFPLSQQSVAFYSTQQNTECTGQSPNLQSFQGYPKLNDIDIAQATNSTKPNAASPIQEKQFISTTDEVNIKESSLNSNSMKGPEVDKIKDKSINNHMVHKLNDSELKRLIVEKLKDKEFIKFVERLDRIVAQPYSAFE